MKKYIDKVAPIQLVDPNTKKPLEVPPTTQAQWVTNNLLSNQAMGDGLAGMRRVMKVADAFEKDVIEVDVDDHQILLSVLRSIKWQNPVIAAQYYRFAEAIEYAKDEKPEEVKAPNGQVEAQA